MADEIKNSLNDSQQLNNSMKDLVNTLNSVEIILRNIQYGFESFAKAITGVSGSFLVLGKIANEVEHSMKEIYGLNKDIKNTNIMGIGEKEKEELRILKQKKQISEQLIKYNNFLHDTQDQINNSLKESNVITKLNKKEVENFTKKVDETAKSAKKVENIFGDTTANIIKINYALKEAFNYVSGIFSFVFNALEKVDKRSQSGILFKALVGKDDPVKKLNEMKEATKFAISETDLIMKTVQARQFGVKTDINYLLETARDLSYITGRSITDTFDDMVLAIGRQSYMIADNMNIMVKKMEAAQNFAKKYGKEVKSLTAEDRKLAFEEEFMRKANENINKFGKAQETVTEKLGRMKSLTDDISVNFAKMIPKRLTDDLNKLLEVVKEVSNNVSEKVSSFVNPTEKDKTNYEIKRLENEIELNEKVIKLKQERMKKEPTRNALLMNNQSTDEFDKNIKQIEFWKKKNDELRDKINELLNPPQKIKTPEDIFSEFKNNFGFLFTDTYDYIKDKIDYAKKVMFHLEPRMQEITDFWQFQGMQFQAHYEAISFNEKLQNDVNEEVDALLSASNKQHMEDYVKFWENQNKQFEKILKLNAEVMKFNMDFQNDVDEAVANLPQQKSAFDLYKENMRGYADALLDGANSVANASEQAMQKFLTFGESFNKNLANLFRSIAQSMQEAMIKPIAQSFGQQIGLSFLGNLSQSATQNQGKVVINNYSGMGAGVSYDNKGNKVVTVGVAQKNNNIKRGLR